MGHLYYGTLALFSIFVGGGCFCCQACCSFFINENQIGFNGLLSQYQMTAAATIFYA